jgi:hypothetical protein
MAGPDLIEASPESPLKFDFHACGTTAIWCRTAGPKHARASLRRSIVLYDCPFDDLLHEHVRVCDSELISPRLPFFGMISRARFDAENHVHGAEPGVSEKMHARRETLVELVHRRNARTDRIVESQAEASRGFNVNWNCTVLFDWLNHSLGPYLARWRRQ